MSSRGPASNAGRRAKAAQVADANTDRPHVAILETFAKRPRHFLHMEEHVPVPVGTPGGALYMDSTGPPEDNTLVSLFALTETDQLLATKEAGGQPITLRVRLHLTEDDGRRTLEAQSAEEALLVELDETCAVEQKYHAHWLIGDPGEALRELGKSRRRAKKADELFFVRVDFVSRELMREHEIHLVESGAVATAPVPSSARAVSELPERALRLPQSAQQHLLVQFRVSIPTSSLQPKCAFVVEFLPCRVDPAAPGGTRLVPLTSLRSRYFSEPWVTRTKLKFDESKLSGLVRAIAFKLSSQLLDTREQIARHRLQHEFGLDESKALCSLTGALLQELAQCFPVSAAGLAVMSASAGPAAAAPLSSAAPLRSSPAAAQESPVFSDRPIQARANTLTLDGPVSSGIAAMPSFLSSIPTWIGPLAASPSSSSSAVSMLSPSASSAQYFPSFTTATGSSSDSASASANGPADSPPPQPVRSSALPPQLPSHILSMSSATGSNGDEASIASSDKEAAQMLNMFKASAGAGTDDDEFFRASKAVSGEQQPQQQQHHHHQQHSRDSSEAGTGESRGADGSTERSSKRRRRGG